MSFSARLAKLEAKQKQVLACPLCLYVLDTTAQEQKQSQRKPNPLVEFKCWDCGTPFSLSMDDESDYKQYAVTLIYNSHPSKFFNDERLYAAYIWIGLSNSEVKKYGRETKKSSEKKEPTSHILSHHNQIPKRLN